MSEASSAGPRVAVVGCGQIADAHLAEARRAGATVVAVCDACGPVAEQAAARFGVPAWYEDLDALLERERPEVVHVTTPPASHLALARRALAAGAHVYVEKPLTVDAREAEALLEAGRRAGRLVCAGHNLLRDPAIQRLRALLDAGALGEVVHAEAVMGYDLSGPFGALLLSDPGHWVHRLPGGLAQNNLSHPLSLLLPLVCAPGEVPRVHASGRRLRPQRTGDGRDRFHDELRIALEGARATGTVVFSCRARPVQLALTVLGTAASAQVSLDARTVRVVRGARLPGPLGKVDWAFRDASAATAEWLGRAGDLARARLHYFEGMKDTFAAFYAAVRGAGPHPVPAEDALRVTEVMDLAFAALAAAEAPARARAEERAS